MKHKPHPGRCPLCSGTKRAGKTTFTVDLGFGVVVVRDVPATVCAQCGADWIEDSVAAQLEDIVDDARKKHHMVEVTSLAI
jgi:YgiT-type zinc finger domain-containing protein